MGKVGVHSQPVRKNTEEEKKGKLFEKPGWFRKQSKEISKGKLSKDQGVKERGGTKRSVTKTRFKRIETHLQVKCI